ncbi:MacS family sensor histidine kinase [Jiangella mangrovi]|uniref:Signal transduction histidine kinase n=1 Tax=Jiangella mangrovi TaxID=1524084 RepID=A0A7W9LKR3_9ACTN|nr:signal transduction histidine kinase [Jiangella mangrovi]
MDAALPGYEEQWWRALAVFRTFSVLYAATLYAFARDDYEHVTAGWLVLAGLALWTALTFAWYRRPGARRWPLLTVDLLLAAAAVVATRPLQLESAVERGAQTLPVFWVVAPVIGWALVYGWAAALPASVVIGLANVAERGAVTPPLLHNTALVLIAGATVGYVCGLARRSERRLAAALRAQAAAQERDRLARVVHDGVLQVLTYVTRRGRELGGDAAELAGLAAEQEVALRALITAEPQPAPSSGRVDLGELLQAQATPRVSVAVPAAPVRLSARVADELAAAVAAALDNVARHAGPGARAFVLLDDDGCEVTVVVRDDGAGFGPGRLEAARSEGRLGVARSVVGRLGALGGSAVVTGTPGDGVEVTLRLPRRTAAVLARRSAP